MSAKKSTILTFKILLLFLFPIVILSCQKNSQKDRMTQETKIVFLHHSTGMTIWNGNTISLRYKMGQVIRKLNRKPNTQSKLPRLFRAYNKKHNTAYAITEIAFPKNEPYGWKNYPYDYHNIWVKHAGEKPYMEEPTLEMLTSEYQVIIFKHCFPVSNIQPDEDSSSVDSEYKSLGNYKLQYLALRDKMLEFPETKFIVWTGAVNVKNNMTEDEAKRTRDFFTWVRNEWDRPDDNIHLWDLYALQTEGELYFKPEYAVSEEDSHPNNKFSGNASDLLFSRIIDVIMNDGNNTKITGEIK